jgi:hypothetical protein
MFQRSSRYHDLPDAIHVDEHGRHSLYKTRRILPAADTVSSVTTVRVGDEDRLDLIAWRTLGNARLWWRLADANNAMDPEALVERPGRLLRVPGTPTA